MEAIKLTPEERARMNAQAARGLIQILFAQFALLAVVVILAAMIGNWVSAVSAVAGGMTYFLPSLIVTMQMLLRLYSGRNASAGALFIVEGIKICGTVALLFIVAKLFGEWISWPALLAGLISVMKGYLLLLMFRKI